MKIAMRGFSPLLVVFCRMALASAVFALYGGAWAAFAAGRGDWKGLSSWPFASRASISSSRPRP
ncbi:MAG: hypothetical protein AB9872_00595 [Solidesulfovibrio sp.]